MPEATQYMFTHKDVVTALLVKQGVIEGIWQLAISFGFGAANIGDSPNNLNPAAVVPVTSIGIQRVNEQNSLTVDAATLAPAAAGN